MQNSRKAFTLMEVLVVIGIIIVLMSISSSIIGAVNSAQARSKAKADMELIASGLEAFKGQYGDYPRLNAKNETNRVSCELYKCLVGMTFMRVDKGEIRFIDVDRELGMKPFIDVSRLTIANVNDFDAPNPDPMSNDVCFIDPWRNPYIYYYNASTMRGTRSSWKGAGFILLSMGPDGKNDDLSSVSVEGIMNDLSDYRDMPSNADNLIQGYDD